MAAQYRTELIDSAQAHRQNTPLSALAYEEATREDLNEL
jgi:hypothetical protein